MLSLPLPTQTTRSSLDPSERLGTVQCPPVVKIFGVWTFEDVHAVAFDFDVDTILVLRILVNHARPPLRTGT